MEPFTIGLIVAGIVTSLVVVIGIVWKFVLKEDDPEPATKPPTTTAAPPVTQATAAVAPPVTQTSTVLPPAPAPTYVAQPAPTYVSTPTPAPTPTYVTEPTAAPTPIQTSTPTYTTTYVAPTYTSTEPTTTTSVPPPTTNYLTEVTSSDQPTPIVLQPSPYVPPPTPVGADELCPISTDYELQELGNGGTGNALMHNKWYLGSDNKRYKIKSQIGTTWDWITPQDLDFYISNGQVLEYADRCTATP